jgi:O-acetyl-ADP-ribose deacetylase (regulator of RNase III)
MFMSNINLILVDPRSTVCDAFTSAFKDLPDVKIVNGRFEDLPEFDCMVSAANSFGLMDGGVDAAITRFFGDQLMHRVQDRIIEEYLGEQPVGSSMIVETNHPKHPYIAHTPTMRVPMDIGHTDNVYVAMWAMLTAVHRHNQQHPDKAINTVACPGLGTATGNVPHRQAAQHMALAYKNYLNPPHYIGWQYAHERHWSVWMINPPSGREAI